MSPLPIVEGWVDLLGWAPLRHSEARLRAPRKLVMEVASESKAGLRAAENARGTTGKLTQLGLVGRVSLWRHLRIR